MAIKMMLKENIVRIKEMMGLITESKTYLLRRVTVDKINTEFKESLDYVTYKLKGNYGLKNFKERVINVMMDGLHGELSNWGTDHFPYEEIEEFLLDTYSDEMVERYHQMYGDEHLRNLQEETINEDFKGDLIKTIDREGLETASKLVSGYDNLVNLLGDYQIPKKVKIKTIRDYMENIGGLSLFEVNQEPIPYRETNTEYQEIVHLSINSIVVDRWGGYENQTHLGEFPVRYEVLPEKLIDDILEIILNELPEHDL
jgi:hypothetical protein